MIGKKLQNKINEQIKNELESAYLYAAMVAWFKAQNWEGMAHWMEVQTKEEIGHATRFFNYIYERGGTVELKPLSVLKNKWESPLAAFKDAYAHEQFITAKINDLMQLALAENDYATQGLLDWFVKEQVEEEDSVLKVVQHLERAGTSGQALLMVDAFLSKRE